MFPRLFHIGNFNLPTYGVLVATGLIIALLVIVRLAKRNGLDPDKCWNLGVLAVLAGIVGAKILLFITDWDYYRAHPGEIFSLATLQAGGVFFGGLLGAIVVCVWYLRSNHMPGLRTADVFAPGIALGHSIGRLGCFAAGCCYGKPTDLPWGVTFTNPLAHFWVGTPLGVKIHPTQLYESAVELANFALLYWLIGRKRFDGQVIGAYMAVYGFARYFLEFLRADAQRGTVFGGFMTVTQLIAIGMVVAAGVLWLRRPQPQAAMASAAR